MMSLRKACLPLILVICLAAVCGCTGSSGNELSRDSYIAVQEDLTTTCTLIGSENYSPTPHIGYPYQYDYAGSMVQNDGYYPEINDSLKILYGKMSYRTLEPWDTLTGLRIRGVYGFPYASDSGFVFESVDKNGTIFGSFNDTSIVLHSGEIWGSPAFSELKSENCTAQSGNPCWYIASYNTTWTIKNLGVYDRANLLKSNNSKTATGYGDSY
jgi:hypothetical protein